MINRNKSRNKSYDRRQLFSAGWLIGMVKLGVTKHEARALGLHTYTQESPCKRGHTSARYSSTGACIACHEFYEKKPYVKPTGEMLFRQRQLDAERHRNARSAGAKGREANALSLMKSLGFDLPTKRHVAKATGSLHYFTGIPCVKGHIAKRFTTGGCSECALAFSSRNKKQAFEKDPDAVRQADRDRYRKNPDRVRQQNKRYRVANKDMVRAKQRAYIKANPRPKEDQNLMNAKRRASKLNATPPWTTREMRAEMKALYRESIEMGKQLGVTFHVDHIVPLKGVTVCGLHVPWNLRIITQEENLSRPKQFSEPHLGRYCPLPLGGGAVLAHYQL